MLKRLLAIILAAMLLLTACSSGSDAETGGETGGDTTTSTPADDATESSIVTPAGEYPIVTEPVELSLFVHTRLGVDSFAVEDNLFTQYLTENTGVDFTFVTAPESDAQANLNVLLAGGDYPDVINSMSLQGAQVLLYGERGLFLRLNDYIDEYAVNLKAAFEEYPEYESTIAAPDGSIYTMPDVNDCYHCSFDVKMWVNQVWLDNLGLDVPTTTDEFADMLRAFKNDDPNGNGQQDEIPLMGSNLNGWNSFPENFLMNSFVYFSNRYGSGKYGSGIYSEDGTLTAAYTTDAWKDGLTYMNMLVSEGLLAPETYTQDNNVLLQTAENSDALIGAIPSGYMGMFSQTSTSDRWRDYVAIAPLEGPDGVRYSEWNPYSAATFRWVVTDKCEYPEVAVRVADFMYEYEATQSMVFGPVGVGWEDLNGENPDILGINGEPAIYQALMPVDEQTPNSSWNQLGTSMRTREFRSGAAAMGAAEFEKPLEDYTRENYEPYAPDIDMLLPPLVFTEEQSETLLPIESTVRTYVEEKTAAFITGGQSIDDNWDSYLAELEAMGLQTLLETYQEAYNTATAG